VAEITLDLLSYFVHVIQQLVGFFGQRFFQVFAHTFRNGRRLSIGGNSYFQITLGYDRAQIKITQIWCIGDVNEHTPRAGKLANGFMKATIIRSQNE